MVFRVYGFYGLWFLGFRVFKVLRLAPRLGFPTARKSEQKHMPRLPRLGFPTRVLGLGFPTARQREQKHVPRPPDSGSRLGFSGSRLGFSAQRKTKLWMGPGEAGAWEDLVKQLRGGEMESLPLER